MEKNKKRLGEILVEKGYISAEQLNAALEEQKRTKELLGMILLRKGRINEHSLLTALSEQLAIPLVSLKNRYIDFNMVKGFTASLVLDYKCFPVEKDSVSVTMALSYPFDSLVLQKAEDEAKGLRLKLVLVTQEDLKTAIEKYRQYVQKNIGDLFK